MSVTTHIILAVVLLSTASADNEDQTLKYAPMMNILFKGMQPAAQDSPSSSNDNVPVSLGKKAEPCDKDKCKLPNCLCSSTDTPGNMSWSDIPQMVVVTFQNAVNDQNYNSYLELFAKKTNPNGCPGLGTFYVSHEYTDYFWVQSLWAQGHEIGDNTVTSQSPASYWANATYEIWKAEIESQAQILNQWAEIPNTFPAGFRSPFLELGGDEQFTALRDTKMLYDATRVSTKYVDVTNGFLWPYSYDYQSAQDCVIGRCPSSAYPNLWQLPLPALKDKNKMPCSTLDACFVENEDDVYNLLMTGFAKHYAHSRAPYVLNVGTAWMVTAFKKAGTLKFLDKIMSYDSAYLVSAWQAIEWTKDPTSLDKIKSFKPWSCSDLPHKVCDESKVNECFYDKDRKQVEHGGVYRFRTCVGTCPKCYPWVNDPFGKSC